MEQSRYQEQKLRDLRTELEGCDEAIIALAKSWLNSPSAHRLAAQKNKHKFSNECFLRIDQVRDGIWPADESGCPRVFHPDIIWQKLHPSVTVNKSELVTAFIEYCKAVHVLWVNEELEPVAISPIEAMREYIKQIAQRYGCREMEWAIDQAALLAPSSEALIDAAAHGTCGWIY